MPELEQPNRKEAWQLLQLALQIATTIQDADLKASAMETIALAQAKAEDVQGALRTTSTLEAGSHYQATAFLLRMLGLGDRDILQPGSYDRTRVLQEMALAQVKAGDTKGALRTARRFPRRSYVRAYVLREIAVTQAKAGDVRGALQSAAMVRSRSYYYIPSGPPIDVISDGTIERGKGEYDDRVSALVEIALVQAKGGDRVGANRTFEQALQASAAVQPFFNRIYTLVEIAMAQAEAGDKVTADKTLEKALQVVSTIPHDSLKANRPGVSIRRTVESEFNGK